MADPGNTANSNSTLTKRLAVIGGTSLISSSLFKSLKAKEISTSHGSVQVHISPTLVYVNRHHTSPTYAQPALINHRATFAALQKLRVTKILAVCSVGSLTQTYPPGSLVLPDDYFGLFDSTSAFYHTDYRAHIIPTLDGLLRGSFATALKNASIPLTGDRGTYVQTRGPRFETPAEIQFLVRLKAGDVIGMTSASEATIAKELDMAYQPLCMVDNYANGIGEKQLTMEEFEQNVAKHQPLVERAVQAIINSQVVEMNKYQ